MSKDRAENKYCNVDPDFYDTEEEYLEALNEAKKIKCPHIGCDGILNAPIDKGRSGSLK